MVRVISVASLGYDDYGGFFSDREVDGIDYDPEKKKLQELEAKNPESKVVKATKLKGGRKCLRQS